MASSAMDALKREHEAVVDEVWIDDSWKKMNMDQPKPFVGFKADEAKNAA